MAKSLFSILYRGLNRHQTHQFSVISLYFRRGENYFAKNVLSVCGGCAKH